MERRFEKMMKNNKINWIVSIGVIIFSAFVYSIGVVLFVSEAKLLASGVSGMSLIIGRLIEESGLVNYTEAQISGIFYFVLNLPIMVLSFRKFNIKFSILSILHMVFTSLFTSILDVNVLMDIVGISSGWQIDYRLESALFSGVMCGFSTAICYLVGGSSAGVDLLAAYLSSKKQLSVGKINAIVNACIIALSIILWSDEVLNALFTLAFIFINASVIDMIFVANRKVVVTIITEKGDEISDLINSNFTRGVTRIKAIGNYTKREKDFLYIACTSNEALEIADLAKQIDEHSFTSVSNAQRISGYFLNKSTK
jgi:uncharacterized membrane-anchored protein YitT (DUF2179 family)